ncbi:MAG TPA: response regulator [Abditibacteriaceae bacterium]|nr:response regulator [Abditibacteriaceae bacterium]
MILPALAGKRILVIEDTEENLRLFRAILKLEGAIIMEADRARKGIEIAEREQPDLILMDIHMPEMDGLTATRLLRAGAKTAHIPIIAVTAAVMDSDRAQTFAAGCNDYIPKPIDPISFVEKIALYLCATSPQGSTLDGSTPDGNTDWAHA